MIPCSFPFGWRSKTVDSCLEVSSDPIVAGALVCVAFGETVAPNSSWISLLLLEPPCPSMKDRIKVHRFLPLNVVEKGRTPFSAKMVPSKPVLSCNEVAFGMSIVLPGFASRAG
jgi:hypothetical protein